MASKGRENEHTLEKPTSYIFSDTSNQTEGLVAQ